MSRVYKVLLQLYPADYADVFSPEMLAAFEQAFEEHRRLGSAGLLHFLLAELISLLRGIWAEWVAKTAYNIYHSNSYTGQRCAPDRRLMRPPGVDRESYFAEQNARAKVADLIEENAVCVNAQQRFVFASPLRRLLILTCAVFLPMHPCMSAKTRVWNRQD